MCSQHAATSPQLRSPLSSSLLLSPPLSLLLLPLCPSVSSSLSPPLSSSPRRSHHSTLLSMVTSLAHLLRARYAGPISLRARYAMAGTVTAYARCGTGVRYAAMRCTVPTQHMLLCHTQYRHTAKAPTVPTHSVCYYETHSTDTAQGAMTSYA
eukprot:1750883-Rhodomonas_salina.2